MNEYVIKMQCFDVWGEGLRPSSSKIIAYVYCIIMILARCPDSSERLNGFNLAIIGSS